MKISQYKQALIDSKHLIKEDSKLLNPAATSGYHQAENGYFYHVCQHNAQPVCCSSIGRSAELYHAELEGESKLGIDGDNSTAEFERYYDFVIEKLNIEAQPEQPEAAAR
jgi:hypothetical protein